MGIVKSKIFSDTGLLLQEYSGDLTKEDMVLYFTGLYANPEYLNVSVIFSDFTKANVMLSYTDVFEIADFIFTHAPKVKPVDNAILVNKPLITAYSMIYETLMKKMPFYHCEIFSTAKEAANFIQYDPKKLEILRKESFTL
jgi:hypothetical protein